MKDWVDINLKYRVRIDLPDSPFEEVCKQLKAVHGWDFRELEEAAMKATEKPNFSATWEKVNAKYPHVTTSKGIRQRQFLELFAKTNPKEAKAVKAFWEVQNVHMAHPLNKTYQQQLEQYDQAVKDESFIYHEMFKPGVQFEIAGGRRYLIGDLNKQGSALGDGEDHLENYTFIVRARVVFDPTVD